MSQRGDPRTADSRCEAVRQPRRPTMIVIAAGDHRGDRKNCGSMPGGKRAALERRLAPTKKCVVKRSCGRNITRSLPASHRFHRQVDYSAVSIGLPGEQCRTHLIRVMPRIACNHKRNRHRQHFPRGNRGIKNVVDVVEIPRMRTKIGHGVRIGKDESGRSTCNGESGQQVVPSRKLTRKQPNHFLIVEKVLWHGSPGHLSLRPRVIGMFGSARHLRRTVRQVCTALLRAGPI